MDTVYGIAMYSNFLLNEHHQRTQQALNFQKCIIGGNWTMLASFFVAALCVMVTFQFAHLFSMTIQISAHIATIVFASLFKVGYVIRCVGVHGLGYKVF